MAKKSDDPSSASTDAAAAADTAATINATAADAPATQAVAQSVRASFVPVPAAAFLAGLGVARAMLDQLADLEDAKKAIRAIEQDARDQLQAVRDAQAKMEARCRALQVEI